MSRVILLNIPKSWVKLRKKSIKIYAVIKENNTRSWKSKS